VQVLNACPFDGPIPLGLYELPRRSGEAHLYRLNHPLAEAVLAQAKMHNLPLQEVQFDYSDHDGKVTILEPCIGQSGWLTLSCFMVESLDQAEDHLIFAASTNDGAMLEEEQITRLFTLPGQVIGPCTETIPSDLDTVTHDRQAAIQHRIAERNAKFFEEEAEKLDGWADDIKLGLEREIKDLDRQIREARRAAKLALTLEEKLAGQKQVKALESQRNQRRRSLFDAQDEVDHRREELIAQIEGKLRQKTSLQRLFAIRWRLS